MAKFTLPRDHISVTQVEMYLRCARQYEFRYPEGIKVAPAIAMAEGGNYHDVLAENNTEKAKSGTDLSLKWLMGVFLARLDGRTKEVEDWEGETVDSLMTRAEPLLGAYLAGPGMRIWPVKGGVERELKFKINGIPFLGYVDVETGEAGPGTAIKKAVIDYKVTGRAKGQSDVDSSLQLSAYAMGTKKKHVGFCSLIKSKAARTDMKLSTRTKRDLVWFGKVVEAVATLISAGSFAPCDPTSWCCDPRYCGYYSMCRGAK